jgi:putative SOS response-associated peptidase YedK
MSWRERPAPNAPTLQHLADEEIHVTLTCNACHRTVRLTPTEAMELLGPDCTMMEARDRLRCSWCGAAGRSVIDVRPCTLDISAKRVLEDARRNRMVWPQDPRLVGEVAEREAAWAARRPRDGTATRLTAYRMAAPISEIERDLRTLGLPLIFPGGATPNDWPRLDLAEPGQVLPVFRPVDPLAPAEGLGVVTLRWGLVPFFHRGSLAAWTAPTANARAEILATSRNFRAAFERRRCLVPADAVRGGRPNEAAWDMHPTPGSWWPLAGLWDRAETRDGRVESFAIVTLDVGPAGNVDAARQPLRLTGADVRRWLDLSADVSGILGPSAAAGDAEASAA